MKVIGLGSCAVGGFLIAADVLSESTMGMALWKILDRKEE